MQAPSEELGRLLRHGLETTMSGDAHARLRRRVIERATASRGSSLALPSTGGLALAAIALVLWVVVRTWSPIDRISFGVGEPRGGRLDTHYEPAPGQQRILAFSDGSSVTLRAGSVARVTKLASTGAVVRLENGRADVEIEPHEHASWRFVAGPYAVQVVGTSFEIAWTPKTETLEIQMRSGKVVVHGPGVRRNTELSGTEKLVATAPRPSNSELGTSTLAAGAAGDDTAEPGGGPETAAPTERSDGERALGGTERTPPLTTRSDMPTRTDAWTNLALRGEYAQAIHAAEAEGLAGLLGSEDSSRLALLADAARYARRTDLARQVLLVIRERFPGSTAAASGAYMLGRMADDGGSPAQALPWYDAYLAEAPAGALAAEANGRRMVTLQRLGELTAARQAAESYLERYPAGAHARHAEELKARVAAP